LATLFRAQNVKSLAELIRESEPPSSGSAIVPLQVAGSLPPLFCGPVSGGSAYFYRSLALTVGSEQPLYTFEPRGTDGVNEPFETVEEMASYYIDNMRTVQPEGPYYLGGLSFGGVIAFEMAKQLHAGSERVAVVAMVDSFAPGYPKSITHANTHRTYFAALWYRIVHHRENLAVCPSLRSKLSYMRVRAGFMVSKGARRNSGSTDLFEARRRQLNLPEMLQKVAEAEARALKLYKPEPYRGEIKLLKARAGSPHFMPAKYNGWEGLASGGIELIVTPGTHYSMLDEPCIHTTLKRLKRLIEDARQPCGKTNTE
jgi:aspartate racemase